jgi:hypothetical protein
VNLIGLHREQHLARAAELAEPGEDKSDHLLETQIGIETKPDFTVPDIAERNRYPQLAPAGLGPSGIQHPRPQHTELELADAALHAQQQAIIGSTRIVDAVEIDDAGFDKPAEFEQVMPVAAVSGEPRRIEAKNGTDLAGAQPRDQPVEAGARYRSASRSAKIIVNDFDIDESALASDVDQIVLAPLALQVGRHLGLRRLTHIHDRLPLEDDGWDQLSGCHRQAPRREYPPPA